MHPELLPSFHPISLIPSYTSEIGAVVTAAVMTGSAALAVGWCITGLLGGGNTPTVAMNITASERGKASSMGHFSCALVSSPFTSVEGSVSLACFISWRPFWLEFQVKHESGSLERHFWRLGWWKSCRENHACSSTKVIYWQTSLPPRTKMPQVEGVVLPYNLTAIRDDGRDLQALYLHKFPSFTFSAEIICLPSQGRHGLCLLYYVFCTPLLFLVSHGFFN